MQLFTTLLCSLLSIAAMFLFSRLMGRRQIAQMTFFDYINGVTAGSIAAELAVCRGENWQGMLLGLAVYTAAVCAVSWLCTKSVAVRRVVEGKPLVLMEHGELFEKNLAAARLDVHLLLTLARCEGYFDLSQIEAAVWEMNGKVSFLPKSRHRPLTPADLQMAPPPASLCAVVVSDGRVMPDCLAQAGYTEQWLREKLKQQGLSPEQVTLATVDGAGQFLAFQRRGELVIRHVFL